MHETELMVLPCHLNDVGSQRCCLGTSLMNKQSILLYDSIKIECTGRISVLCRAWPRLDNVGNGYIQFDSTVLGIDVDHENAEPDSIGSILSISEHNIQKVTCSAVESVSLTVVVTDWREFMLCSKNSTEFLQCKIRNLLTGFVIAASHTVLCSRTTLGKLYCWDRIIFHSAVVKNNCFCGFITLSSKIIVVDVISKERLAQHTQKTAILGGLQDEVNSLSSIVLQSQTYGLPESCYKKQGVLVTGSSGCGKTSLVKLVAKECDAFLIHVGDNVHSSRPGESEQNLRDAFMQAAAACLEGLCILFLDDIDAICPRCRDDSDGLSRRMLAELLSLLEEHEHVSGLTVIAATSRPSEVDPCLRRVGRFEKEILLSIPDEYKRYDILKMTVPEKALSSDVDLHYLAQATPGFTGADLSSLVKFAMTQAVDRGIVSDSKKLEVCINAQDFTAALHHIRPSVQRGADMFITNLPHINWRDIGGLTDVKEKLKQCVEWPLKHPHAYSALGLRLPRGILLYGPPGCAKTSLVRAAASSCHVNFLVISGAQLFSPYLGEAEKKIAEVFHQARACAPTILFIDEIDSVIGSRAADGGEAVQQRVLATLLNEMDGIGILADSAQRPSKCKIEVDGDEHLEQQAEFTRMAVDNANVLVIAATNRLDMVDAALLRPGRMDHMIYVPPPDYEARLEILKVYTRVKPTVDVNLEDVARQTDGFTGADLENLCNEASLHAVRVSGFECQHVTGDHFRDVLQWLKPSVSSEELQKYQLHQDSLKL